MGSEMESMVERVARAICAAEGASWRTGFFPIMSGPNFETENHDADKLNNKWRFVARAALEAMREPTLAMRRVATFRAAEVDWPQMIDAALAEASPPDERTHMTETAALDKALEE